MFNVVKTILFQLVFKKPQENEKKPMIKDFHMDPQYRKFMCDQPPTTSPTEEKSDKTHPETETTDMPVSEGEIIIFILLKNVIMSKKIILNFC